MKNYILILFGSLIVLTACKKFDEANLNPNAPEKVNPQFLLSNVLSEATNNQAYWGWHAGSFLAQHASNLEFLPIDRYDLGNNEGLWNETYRLMNDLQDISTSEEGNEAYTAVSQVLMAHQLSLLTDLWTNVPYFEALQGKNSGNFTPKFDSQESIYLNKNGILDLLRTAAATLSTSKASIQGDFMYNGNLNKWQRLANSLRVRYLLRISKKTDVSIELQQILDEGMLFLSNADQAAVPYLNSAPNQWTIYTEREGRYVDVRMSTSAQQILEKFSDPRMGVFYKPTVNSLGGTAAYSGIPNGLSRESQNAYDLNDVSLMGSFLRDIPDGVSASFMTYAELQFCLAEAAQRGLISGNASTFYATAIQASFDFYKTPLPNNYLTQTEVVLDGSADLERILNQKWLASFMNGYEAWFDIRRTGYPNLTVPQDNLNGDVYPVRYRYPSTEQAVNGANYSAAVTTIGGDNYNSKGWWEQ